MSRKRLIVLCFLMLGFTCSAVSEICVDEKSRDPRCATGKNMAIVVYSKSTPAVRLAELVTGIGGTAKKAFHYKLYQISSEGYKICDSGKLQFPSHIYNADVAVTEVKGKTIVAVCYLSEPNFVSRKVKCIVGVVNDNNKIEWGKSACLGRGFCGRIALNDKGKFAVVIQKLRLNKDTIVKQTSGETVFRNNNTLYYQAGKVDVSGKKIVDLRRVKIKKSDVVVNSIDVVGVNSIRNGLGCSDIAIADDGMVMIVYNMDQKLFLGGCSFEKWKETGKMNFADIKGVVDVNAYNPEISLDIKKENESGAYNFITTYNSSENGAAKVETGKALYKPLQKSWLLGFLENAEYKDIDSLSISHMGNGDSYFSVFCKNGDVKFDIVWGHVFSLKKNFLKGYSR